MHDDFNGAVDEYLVSQSEEAFEKLDTAFERNLIRGLVPRPDVLKYLTPKMEASVILLLYGMERWEVASAMGVEPKTVKMYWMRARHKLSDLGVNNVFED